MPIYEFVCLDCSKRFEVLRAMREADDPAACENCHSLNTSRMLSLVYAHGSEHIIAGKSSGCGSCVGGSCSTCGR